jgi:hypothetical protein
MTNGSWALSLPFFSKMANGGHLGIKIMHSKCKIDARNEFSNLKLAGKHES